MELEAINNLQLYYVYSKWITYVMYLNSSSVSRYVFRSSFVEPIF